MSDALSTVSSAAVNPAPYGSVCGSFCALRLSKVLGSGCPPGSCPAKGPGRGGIGRECRFPQIPVGAGPETPNPECRDELPNLLGVPPGVFPPPSSQAAPPDSRHLFSIHFYLLPPASITKDNNKEPGLLPFPKRITIQLRAGLGCCRPVHPTSQPVGSRGTASPPRHGAAHHGAPGYRG